MAHALMHSCCAVLLPLEFASLKSDQVEDAIMMERGPTFFFLEGHLSSWASTPDIWLFDEPIHSDIEIKRNVSPGKIFIHGFGSRHDVPLRNGDKSLRERFDKRVPDSKTEDRNPGVRSSATSELELSRKEKGHGRLYGGPTIV